MQISFNDENIPDGLFDSVSDELSNDEAIQAICKAEMERFGIPNDCYESNIVRWRLGTISPRNRSRTNLSK